jgi:DNA repair protein RadC
MAMKPVAPLRGGTTDQALLSAVFAQALPPGEAASASATVLAEFGDLAAALAAEPARLAGTPGLGERAAALLGAVQALAVAFAAEQARQRPHLGSVHRIMAYLAATGVAPEPGGLRALFLDAQNRLLADERLDAGEGSPGAAFPGDVVRQALRLRAAALVLVHHHASGDPLPDQDDILRARHIQEVAESVGIALHDHMVVGASGPVSMRQLGLMPGLLRVN